MSGSLNKVMIIGHLGEDPKISRAQDGRAIINMNVATSDQWRDKDTGERKERTEWHRVVVFNEGLAKVCEQYLKKGSKVYLEGSLQTRKWQDQQGQDRFTTEVVLQGYNCTLTMLDSAKYDRQERAPEKARHKAAQHFETPARGKQAVEWDAKAADLNDEIPF